MRTFITFVSLLLKTWFRSKTSLFFGLALPITLLLVFGTIFGGPSPPSYSLYVRNLDLDGSGEPAPLSKAFIDALNSSVFEVKLLPPDAPPQQSTGFTAVRILTIPQGFTGSLLNASIRTRIDITADTLLRFVEIAGENISSEVRANISRGIEAMEDFKQSLVVRNTTLILEGSPDDRILQAIEGILNVIASKFELGLLNASAVLQVKTQFHQFRQLRAVDYYMPGYIAAFIMTNGLLGVSQQVSEYRRRCVIKLLASTPVSKSFWIASIVAVQTIASLVLTSVMILAGWLVFRIAVYPDVFSLAVILLGTLAFTGFGVLIGSVLKEAEAVAALGNTLSFPMMFLSGAFWPLELMPGYLQAAARYMPLYYFHVALRETLVSGSPATAIIPALVVAVTAVAATISAVAATKWKDF
ncbi:MAG: ABC transporter permease [Nitrososphaerota archaeon]